MSNFYEKEPQIKAPRVTPLEGVYTYCSAIRGRGVENPQGFGIDERRFVNKVYLRLVNDITPQRTRRTQSIATHRQRTQMTRIGQIFTDIFNPCASVSRNFGLRSVGVCFAYPLFDKPSQRFSSVKSVFYRNYSGANQVSAFICVHLRLIFHSFGKAYGIKGWDAL